MTPPRGPNWPAPTLGHENQNIRNQSCFAVLKIEHCLICLDFDGATSVGMVWNRPVSFPENGLVCVQTSKIRHFRPWYNYRGGESTCAHVQGYSSSQTLWRGMSTAASV